MHKKRNIIALLAVAIVCVLAMPLLPHHHHGSEPCMVREHCAGDHAANDGSTHHHGDRTACVAEGGTLFVRTQTADSLAQARLLPAALPGASLCLTVVSADIACRQCPHRQPGCKSADLSRAKQLRAPPALSPFS